MEEGGQDEAPKEEKKGKKEEKKPQVREGARLPAGGSWETMRAAGRLEWGQRLRGHLHMGPPPDGRHTGALRPGPA
jgi:hypothetical protein